jgi:nicotinamidase-related amidase
MARRNRRWLDQILANLTSIQAFLKAFNPAYASDVVLAAEVVVPGAGLLRRLAYEQTGAISIMSVFVRNMSRPRLEMSLNRSYHHAMNNFPKEGSMLKTALLVVDAQESFRHRPYWSDADAPDFVRNLQNLIDGCVVRNVPIVQIFHVEDEGAFALSSGHITTFESVKINPDVVFHKRYHSALAGTPLAAWLNERGVRRLIVSGVRTEQCCETTTRHAFDSGFEVDFVTEATLTFAMTHPRNGRAVTAAELKERTELVLDGRFAHVATVEEALAKL